MSLQLPTSTPMIHSIMKNRKRFLLFRRPRRDLCSQCPTHHDVSSANELQTRLEDGDVQDVNEVAQVVGQQPVVNIVRRLVGEGPAHGDEPHVPVPREGNQEHPQHVHQVCGERERETRRGESEELAEVSLKSGQTGIIPDSQSRGEGTRESGNY